MKISRRRLVGAGLTAAAFGSVSIAKTAAPKPPADAAARVTPKLIAKLRKIVDAEIVLRSVRAQNARYGELSLEEIKALDDQWRAERKADDKPLISMTLSNPLSSYLTRVQANELGMFAAIFVMDQNGLNAGQSAITGDFWQGDEAKFKKTYPIGADAVFVDEPEWVDEFTVWIIQISMTLVDDVAKTPIGAVTFDVNLAELERRGA
ncbi:MAG: hypothetical protein MRY74_07685 [Neomegalonema sp.]|nr:hypothetical protein [Neomegalonema sp.]